MPENNKQQLKNKAQNSDAKVKTVKFVNFLSSLVNVVLFIIIALIFSYSIYAINDVDTMYQQAEYQNFVSYKPESKSAANKTKTDKSSFAELQEINSDVIGWIDVYGTTINYPLVHTSDNEKYLNTDVLNGYSAAGSIFLDYRNSGKFTEFNNIIYGHHMAHDAMFSNIGKFKDQEFFAEHKYGELYYDSANHGFEILAYFKTSADDQKVYDINLTTDAEKQDFLDYIKSIATYERLSDFDQAQIASSHMIVLSTCTVETEGRQLLLAALSDDLYPNDFKDLTTEAKYLELDDSKPNVSLWILLGLLVCLALAIVLRLYAKHKENNYAETSAKRQ